MSALFALESDQWRDGVIRSTTNKASEVKSPGTSAKARGMYFHIVIWHIHQIMTWLPAPSSQSESVVNPSNQRV